MKIGARVKVYPEGPEFIGTVTGIREDGRLFVTEDGFYSCHNDAPFRREWCRKLVKMRKCDECNSNALNRIGLSSCLPLNATAKVG